MCESKVSLLSSQPEKVDKQDLKRDYGKNKYKIHYIYREFQIDFFRMDLNSLPKNASLFKIQQTQSACDGSLSYLPD